MSNLSLIEKCKGYWNAKKVLQDKPADATHFDKTFLKVENAKLYSMIDGIWVEQYLSSVSPDWIVDSSISLLSLIEEISSFEEQLTGEEGIGWNDQIIRAGDDCFCVNTKRGHGNDLLIKPLRFFDKFRGIENYFARCIHPQLSNVNEGTYEAAILRHPFPEERNLKKRIYKNEDEIKNRNLSPQEIEEAKKKNFIPFNLDVYFSNIKVVERKEEKIKYIVLNESSSELGSIVFTSPNHWDFYIENVHRLRKNFTSTLPVINLENLTDDLMRIGLKVDLVEECN